MANTTWEPERFANLSKLLLDSLELTDESPVVDQLTKQLEMAKPDLAALFEYPGKNAQHRDELSKGTPSINGEKFKVSEEFIVEAKKLSDFLELDEDLAATLVHKAIPYEKRFELPPAESAIVMFFSEREAKLLSIIRLLTGGANQTVDVSVREVLGKFVHYLLSTTLTSSNKMFPERVLATMGELKTKKDKVTALLNGPSADVPYSRDIVEFVQTKLGDERKQLAMIIFWIIHDYQLNSKETISVVEWLRGSSVEDPATLYMTVALLTAMNTSTEGPSQVQAEEAALNKIRNLERDSQFLAKLNAEVIDKAWNDDGLKGLIWLQWALLATFGIKQSQGFGGLIGIREDRFEGFAQQGIQMGAYRFAVDYLLGYRITDHLEYDLSAEFLVLQRQTTTATETRRYPHFTDIPVDFQQHIEHTLEDTLSALLSRMSGVYRQMRYVEEDAIVLANENEERRALLEDQRQQQQQRQLQQSSAYPYSRPIVIKPAVAAAAAATEILRRDTEALFLLITVLYAERPDAGLRFWGRADGSRVELDDRMAVFLRWGSSCKDIGLVRGYYNMLSSLACGAQASVCAHEFLGASENKLMSPSRAHVASNQAPRCSWQALFGALSHYASSMRQKDSADASPKTPDLPDGEAALLRSLLRLCRTTVRYSIVARMSLYENAEYNAVVTMFDFLGCAIPVSLKASLLDTIAAFGELGPEILGGGGEADNARQLVDEMARRIWAILEQSQTLPTTNDVDALRQARPFGMERVPLLPDRTPQRGISIGRGSGNRQLLSRGGIVYELEEVEAAAETYPEMRAFVRLISSLIHVSNSAAALSNLDRDPILYSAPSPSIPMDLGESYRTPGITPYLVFVLESVMLKAEQRSYQYSTEKWSVYAVSLDAIERSLGTLDLSGLVAEAGEQRLSRTDSGLANSLRALVTHPGFEIVIRILCGSKLLDALLNILNVGVDEVNMSTGDVGECINQSVLCTLRILLRILRIQETLLRTVIPLLLESSDMLGFPLTLPRSLTTLEQLLLSRRQSVVQIVTYVSCTSSADICLATIKILHILSDSVVFNGIDDRVARGADMLTVNRLVGMIDRSEESVRIVHGFINCLGVEDDDSVAESREVALISEAAKGFTSGLEDQQSTGPAQSIRLAIIDLLLANLTPTKPAPTIAHYLLGFSLTRPASDDLPDPSQRATCLHTILDLLREGHGEAGPSSLISKRPRLAERCYHLMYHLCSDAVTGDVTTRFLRGRENFFYSQLSSTPMAIVPDLRVLGEEPQSVHSPIRVYAQLHGRSWLWRSSALELHTLVLQDARSRAKLIGEWLVGDAEQTEDGDGSVFSGGSILDSRMRILAMFDSLRQAYRDSSSALQRQQRVAELEYLRSDDSMMDEDDDEGAAPFGRGKASLGAELLNVDVNSCIVTNERGCAVYDLHALVALLRQAEQALDQGGQLGSAGARQRVFLAIRRVVIRSYFGNQERELHYAYASALRGWKELAEILVTSAWNKIDSQGRAGCERTAFQLLRGLVRVLSENDPVFAGGASKWCMEPPTAEQEFRHAELLTALAPTLTLFAERLSQEWTRAGVLTRASLAMNKPGAAGQARVMPPALDTQLPVEPLLDTWRMLVCAALTPAAAASLLLRGNVYAAMLHVLGGIRKLGESSSSAGQKSRLVSGALDILADSAALGDRLLEAASADAADSSDAWKTVAFSLLNALASLFAVESRPNRVVMLLARKNFFASFVGSILHREDHAIQAALQPDPASLNALYIYEAKMSFFLRIAQRSDGAERLLENGIIDVLADCAFLDLRPQSDHGASFADAFIPIRAERFHLLLMPALNLMLALVARIGRDNLTLWMKAARFVSQHHAVLEAILKEAAAPAHLLSIALLTEAKAVTSLVFFIARQRAVLDREAAMAGSGHVGVTSLHLPILALLPKLSTSTNWANRLMASNDVERAQMLVPASTFDDDLRDSTATALGDQQPADVTHTVFGQQASELVDSIVQNAIAYAQAVTERSFRPAFSWSIEHSREADYTPSLATLVAFVRRSLAQIERGRRTRDEKLRLAKNPNEMSTADMRKLIHASPHVDCSDDLSAQQMRALASVLLEQQGKSINRSLTGLVAAVEQALVLLWRHLSFFISIDSGEQQQSVRGSLTMPSQQEKDTLRSDASIELPPLLTLLAGLKLSNEEFATASNHMSFIQMLVRSIKDLVLRDISI